MFAAEFPAAADGNERDEENGVRDVIRPHIVLHKGFNVMLEGEESHKGEGDDELSRQHKKNLKKNQNYRKHTC